MEYASGVAKRRIKAEWIADLGIVGANWYRLHTRARRSLLG